MSKILDAAAAAGANNINGISFSLRDDQPARSEALAHAAVKARESAEAIAKALLSIDVWRTHWRVEVEGCVFKIKIEGYPRYGTPRWRRRQDEIEAAQREIDEQA